MFTLAYPWLLVLVILPLLLGRLLPAFRQTRAALMVPFLGRLTSLTGQQPASGAVMLRPPLGARP